MATVIFYEKPGCANNNRQKKLLVAAGHQVIAKNLLIEVWKFDSLHAFFEHLPVPGWFNYSAPAIKLGEIEPDSLTESEALSLMLENPLLIRRPLMQVGDSRMAGFNQDDVNNWIGLADIESSANLERCFKTQACHDGGHE
jgi:nitrogenase-associated protein